MFQNDRLSALTPAGIALASAVIFTWPLAARPGWVGSHPLGESDNHLWMFWRAIEQIRGAPGPLANLPEGLPLPLMDPINLPLGLPGLLIDPALGYNQILLANLLLAFAGGFALARELGASRAGASLAGVAAGCSPFLSGVIAFGITESWALGWIGLHAAALLAWGRTGRLRYAAGAGLALAAFALSGWYHALFALAAEIWLAPWAIARAGSTARARAGRAAGVAIQGIAACAVVLPRFLAFREVQGFWRWRWRGTPEHAPPVFEMWRDTPIWGTDLLNLVLPAVERVPISKSVYVGGVALALALFARGGARGRVWPLWGIALSLWVLAMGHWLSIAGQTELLGRQWALPGWYLSRWFPDLQGVTHWHRAAGPATIFLAALAGLGADRLLRGRAAWIALAGTSLLADNALLSQTPWPRDGYAIEPPAAWAALSDGRLDRPGGVILLPFDNGRRQFTDDVPRIYNRWQPSLGRPVTENYEGRDAALAKNTFVATADHLCGVDPTVPKGWKTPKALIDKTLHRRPKPLARALREVSAWGVAYVVLHADRAETPERASGWLREVLGAPVHDEGGVEIYEIHTADDLY